MEDRLIRKQRLALLLDQIALPDEKKAWFEEGYLQKLVIQKEQKKWMFHLSIPSPLPIHVYEIVMTLMKRAFQSIAEVDCVFHCDLKEITSELAKGYWNASIEQMQESSLPVREMHGRKPPEFQGNKAIVTVSNDAQAILFQRKLAPALGKAYQSFGFPPLSFETRVKKNEVDYQNFIEKREQEDKTKVLAALMEKEKAEKRMEKGIRQERLKIGYGIQDEPVQIQSIVDEERKITVQGYVFDAETRELRSGRTLLTFKITDYTDSILIKMFSKDKEDIPKLQSLEKGMWVKARGGIQNDTFVRDLVMMANDIEELPPVLRQDEEPENEKRVELHLHTPMSQMDAISSTSSLIEQAAKWGHPAIAITDHAVVQSYPEAYSAGKKHGIKVLFGMEANLVDDGVPIAYHDQHRLLQDETFIVFDVETTGLSAVYNKIIELGAVKVQGGEIIDRFESFANPYHPLSQTTIGLTGITDDMVENAPDIAEVLKEFHAFIGNGTLVAHNASFDMGFLNVGFRKIGIGEIMNPVIDTLEFGRFLYPEFKNHRLNTLCKKFDIELEQHHRAIYDAEATGYLLWKMVKDGAEKGISYHDELNKYMGQTGFERTRPSHCTLLAQNQTGLKNIYKLVTESHLNYFYRTPRIPRSKLKKYRDGILIGSGCDKGEVFEAMMQKSPEEVEAIARFYDYLEIQPLGNYEHLIERELVHNELALKEIVSNIVKLGDKLHKPVVATGNVHYLNKNDKIYRRILVSSQGNANTLNRHKLPDVHFRTTSEMLAEFAFLGEEKAKDIVVHATQSIANQIEEIKPIRDELYTPKIEGANDEIRNMSFERARSIYGESLPIIVEERLEKELKSIIGHGFAVIYLISHKLVKKSLIDGYLVGSRGSVGSSFVATMTEITEVNPLPPHYVCPSCMHSTFFDDGSVGSGFDLPDKQCERCNTTYRKDGHDIPFETFLGFKGDKVPDIDLNFSGEYQPRAHNYTKELFGEDYVYRAGTIGTVAEKTAYGFVKGFATDYDIHYRSAEIDRLVSGCTGVKRTTGQHPGGIIVVPNDMDIFDFCPVQFPADDKHSEWKTTHFDFHSIHDNLLKLDILGHDDPTVIRMLQDLSGIDPKTIPTDDVEVMKLFRSTESLGVTEEQIMCNTGTYGIPEFGTRFVRQMLEETKPSSFSELVQISGLSHGTDVWLNNANELIASGTCALKDVIGCRDDIMVYLIYKGLEPSLAFKIMEFVRKGKGLQDEWIDEMKKHDVPDWYIESCKRIKYMFPKAHASAYVLMAVRIAFFKVHHPILFYAAYFTVRADDFDLEVMVRGNVAIRNRISEINQKGLDASPKEKSLLTVLELALEMCERGYGFQKVNLYRSSASEFKVEGNELIPPFNAIPGLGTNAAKNIIKARENGEFLSKEDLQQRSKISKTVLQYLVDQGCLDGLPDANQLSLF